ncbi:ABC transporter ATP-binding protein [Derxia gummosa]|uniref:ABC transporter ATP-binding protein n=1 Tax=Derxia gummosa DSM 723 TaxID=1121388 RepID=A0A8B6X5S1_9BURK|nr:ABC transporter ATP-binding protein [Derxia gummosa]
MPPISLPALSVRDVVKQYRDGPLALGGVSFDVKRGEFFGLLGPNGAGKTTLISIIAGLARATSGNVEVMGHDVVADPGRARMNLGVVPQELVFDPFFTVRETLVFTRGYYGLGRRDPRCGDDWIDEVLHNLDLTHKADANMRALSGGMKRRVLVAQALVHRPPVIILDEPTAGVDVELRQTLWKFIARLNREGCTVILTTHYLEEAEQYCHRVAMLKLGKLVALDDTRTLLRTESSARLLFRLAGAAAGQGGIPRAAAALPPELFAHAEVLNDGRIAVPAPDAATIELVLHRLREAGLSADDIELRHADLEEVFLRLTGNGGDSSADAAQA